MSPARSCWCWRRRWQPFDNRAVSRAGERPRSCCWLRRCRIRFLQSGWHRRQYQGAMPHPQWAIAELLARQGVPAGSRVARIGEAPGTYWARLAGLRLIAEIPAADEFWRASPDIQAARLRRLEAAGARAVVADGRDIAEPQGWIRVAGAPWVIVRTVGR